MSHHGRGPAPYCTETGRTGAAAEGELAHHRASERADAQVGGQQVGRACDAQVCFAESERIFREIRREDELARTLRAWARCESESGDREQAEGMWKEARELFEKLGAVQEVNRMGELQ